ncbi:MAG: hypothetical protein COB50_05275, partial [Thiotrichales bacterium]
MQKFMRTLKNHKCLLITIAILSVIIATSYSISFMGAAGFNNSVIHLSNWIKLHKHIFIFCHIFIVAA